MIQETYPTIEKKYVPKVETSNRTSSDGRTTQPTVNIVDLDVERGSLVVESKDTEYNGDEFTSASSQSSVAQTRNRTIIVSAVIAVFGILAGGFFLGFGIANSHTLQESSFRLVADELAHEFQLAWEDYVMAAKWLHQACEYHVDINRTYFQDIFEHVSYDLDIQAAEWIPRVYHDDRAAFEDSSREYYRENFPEINYRGITGLEQDADNTVSIQNRSEQPFYYPVHYVEPIAMHSKAIDLDLYSAEIQRKPIDRALETFLPTVTTPFRTYKGMYSETQPVSRIQELSILLFHPGIPLSNHPDRKPEHLSALMIKVKDWLIHVSRNLPKSIAVHVYDTTDPAMPEFAIAAELHRDNGVGKVDIKLLEEQTLEELEQNVLFHDSLVKVSSGEWKVRAIPIDGTFEAEILSVLVASICILVASCFMALWIFWDMRRTRSMNKVKRQNDAEKAALVLQSSREATKIEQELNDYIAHEVRNPLSAALSAVTFVKSTLVETPTVPSRDIEDDIQIVDSSLRFINDLLRSMLDFHRAKSKKMALKYEPLDLDKDLLRPVKAMLYTRDSEVKIITECPPGLEIKTDPIRMKQIVLNLGRNAIKFVRKGYIRLVVKVENGHVIVVVEDSGPGIPAAKRQHLFSKFQKSLDAVNQGTGIGLCLCKNMVDLLGGHIYLDDNFQSGVDGCPGTRFVINTKQPPLTPEEMDVYIKKRDSEISTSLRFMDANEKIHTEARCKDQELPDNLSVLFVDDDFVLRKLFTRSVRKVAKTWNVQDASSGEAALELVDEHQFDVIFVDQYMASVEKQMLGTETTRALRAKGVKSIICGLSANDVEAGFFGAGADFFMFKPFPCRPDELKKELLRLLHTRRKDEFLDTSYTSLYTFGSVEN